MSDTNQIERNVVDKKESSKNITEFNTIKAEESTTLEDLEYDYYSFDYNVSDTPFTKYLYRNISNETFGAFDIESTENQNKKLDSNIIENKPFLMEAQIDKDVVPYEDITESSTQHEFTLTTSRSHISSFLNKMSERVTEESRRSSNSSEYPFVNKNITTSSNSDSEPKSTRRESYHLFGREYEFYDQLNKENNEESTFRSAYELLAKINNKNEIEGQKNDSIDSGVMRFNSTNGSSDVHLVLVTTETPEFKNWKKRILQEEIKLLRLKQQLIQHQVLS